MAATTWSPMMGRYAARLLNGAFLSGVVIWSGVKRGISPGYAASILAPPLIYAGGWSRGATQKDGSSKRAPRNAGRTYPVASARNIQAAQLFNMYARWTYKRAWPKVQLFWHAGQI